MKSTRPLSDSHSCCLCLQSRLCGVVDLLWWLQCSECCATTSSFCRRYILSPLSIRKIGWHCRLFLLLLSRSASFQQELSGAPKRRKPEELRIVVYTKSCR